MWIFEALGVILIWALGASAATFMLLELIEPEQKERNDTTDRD